jgi:hypothetical protein
MPTVRLLPQAIRAEPNGLDSTPRGMNLSRFAIAFLMLIPTALFIAAAESAPDPAPANDAQEQKQAAPVNEYAPAVTSTTASASSDAMPLRTLMPRSPLPGSDRGDASTDAAIVSAIRADPGMAGSDVSVNTENGVVSLTGLVRNREQSAIASAYANRQLGVIRVDNALTIPAQ